MVDIRACNTAGCPVDCILSPWLPSTNCSAPCGGGQQTWRRNITTPASNGGQECEESREEARGCNVCPCSRTTDHCPVHCALSPWIPITTCSLTCGGGQQNWTRYVVTPASNGGRACVEARDEVRSCNTAACPVPVDCVLSPWSAITACSSTCGGGNHTWIRTVVTEASSGGNLCDSKRFEVRSCNNEECPEENDSGKNWYESSMTTFCKRLYNFTSDIGLIVGVVVSAVLALALCVGITMFCRKRYECLYCQRNQRTEAAGTIPQNRVENIKNNDDGRVPQYCHQYFCQSAYNGLEYFNM